MKQRFYFFICLLILTPFPINAEKPCVYRQESRWLIPSLAALTAAGGIGLGYAAGLRKNRVAHVQRNLFCTFQKTEKWASLAWIAPNIDAAVDVEAELYAPDQTLYAKATLSPGAPPPPIPPLGGKNNPSLEGIYTAVFTSLTPFTPLSSGLYLGGIVFNGQSFLTAPLAIGVLNDNIQYKIEFFYSDYSQPHSST